MKINLNKEQLENLFSMNTFNNELLTVISKFLTYDSNIINKKIIDDFKKETGLSNDDAYKYLISSCLDEIGNNKNNFKDYVFNKVKILDQKDYFNNPYYKNIKIKNQKILNWELKELCYDSFESFIYKESEVDELNYFKTNPSLGCFSKKFYYPAVLENGREWMTITPNEIETMKQPLEIVKGNVVTFGLGLGYFAYMASIKEEIKKITIIEKDKNAIELFKKIILPQIDTKDKIEILECDAFEYLNKIIDGEYDYVFVDIWHDVRDGLDLYLSFKAIEMKFHKTLFMYWIEKEILIMLRSIIIRLIHEQINSVDSLKIKSSNKEIDDLYKSIYNLLIDYEINNYSDLFKLLSDDGLLFISGKIKKINKNFLFFLMM